MAVAVLNPQDNLKQPFSSMKYPRNPTSCPNRHNKTRRCPPRNQITRSPPPPAISPLLPPLRSAVSSPSPAKKKIQIKILKRGEEIPKETIRSDPIMIPDQIPKETVDLVIEKSDLRSTLRSDPIMIRKSKTVTYAGPVTLTSPPPSDVPLPAFFAVTKKSVSLFESADATNDLIRILRLDIA
ncbi:unnamed protein product [Cochlearia groenlandica]